MVVFGFLLFYNFNELNELFHFLHTEETIVLPLI